MSLAKAKPDTLAYGTAGSSIHLAVEQFSMIAGIHMNHIPYKGSAPAINDLVGGQIQVLFDPFSSVYPQVSAGKARALAVTTERRSSVAPEIPTVAESGYPGFDVSSWQGIVVPAGTSQEIVSRLNRTLLKILGEPAVKARFAQQGKEASPSTPEAFGAYIASEIASWQKSRAMPASCRNRKAPPMTSFKWTPSATLPKKPVSFAGVGYDEMLRRARDLRPKFAERATACEQLRRLPDETERDLHEAGIFRMVQPARVGGADLDVGILVDVCAEIAQVCPSTSWNLGNLSSHHWMLGYFTPEAQDEIWSGSPDVLIATSLAFPAGRGRKVEGGYEVSGRWPLSSGVDNSDWNMLAFMVRERDDGPPVDQRFALVHRSQYEIIDTWHAVGPSGTGSKDVAVKACCARLSHGHRLGDERQAASGFGRETSPLFRLPMLALGPYVLSGVMLGCARGAYETRSARRASATRRRPGMPVGASQAVQIKVAEAGARIDTADMIMRSVCTHAMDVARSGTEPTQADKLRYRRDAFFSVRMCLEAVDILMGVAGSAASI